MPRTAGTWKGGRSMNKKLDEILEKLPPEIRSIVREYASSIVDMSSYEIISWVELALDSPDAALLYLEAKEQTAAENTAQLYEIAETVAKLNLKHTARRAQTDKFIRELITAGLILMAHSLTDDG